MAFVEIQSNSNNQWLAPGNAVFEFGPPALKREIVRLLPASASLLSAIAEIMGLGHKESSPISRMSGTRALPFEKPTFCPECATYCRR